MMEKAHSYAEEPTKTTAGYEGGRRLRRGAQALEKTACVSAAMSENQEDFGGRDDCSEDTIAAISTAIGAGAIGIVKVSGPDAIAVAERIFIPARGTPIQPGETYSLLYGRVVDPDTDDVLDEALLAVMRKPRSYTREDVVEFHCHGGVAAQRAVLRLVVQTGARLAEPGEFTRRAFLNGRIDLAQAESVAAIVAARSSGALRASVRQLDGGLSNVLKGLRAQLIGALAQIEATVDFSDEDVDEVDWPSLADSVDSARSGVLQLLRTAFLGRALEYGVRTVIVGRPNVGKSSLLNALLMRERAIVSDIPGTTRDTVEELLEIAGIPVRLVDTAGLRTDGDHVERLGIARSIKAMEQADLVLAVVDLSETWDEDDRRLILELDPERSIIVGNKADLVENTEACLWALREFVSRAQRRVHAVSALTGSGLEGLRSAILEIVTGGEEFHLGEPILANERQRALVSEASDRLEEALAGIAGQAGEELICEDIRAAAEALGLITGEELTADLIDEIFSKFCLGK